MLMMDALDGELADFHQEMLEAHLRACPSCNREWQALLAVDLLFRQTPAVAPAADFAQRTLARLPNSRMRVWTMSALYTLLLLGGTLPMLLGLWIYNRLGSTLSEPALWRTLWQSLSGMFQVAITVIGAGLRGAGEFVVQQPAIVGWLLVLVGVVSLWGGVFQQFVLQPQPAQNRL
ncbi:MAG: zf-HC2 domain-containing protein [Ardenticatenaceae bacterium]|nr:zf-HC2 domain-containing protein [Ardenticatenaceae bacterium]MCB9445391.1 zf-HC2 domain-containing protein [Ardenticatenaceae bacterium]